MQKQVRSEEPPDGYLALEQNREMLLEQGRSLLTAADQDAMFATASSGVSGQDKGSRGSAGALARYRKNSARMWRKPMRHAEAIHRRSRRRAGGRRDGGNSELGWLITTLEDALARTFLLNAPF